MKLRLKFLNHWVYPLLITLLFYVILASLLTFVQSESQAERSVQMNYDALVMRENLASRVQAIKSYLTMIAEELIDDPQAKRRFLKKNKRFLETHREILALYYLNLDGRPLIRATSSGRKLPPDRNLSLPDARESFFRAKETGSPQISKMFSLISGEKAFLLNVPSIREGEVKGSVSVVVTVGTLLDLSLNAGFFDRYELSLLSDLESYSPPEDEQTIPAENNSQTSSPDSRVLSSPEFSNPSIDESLTYTIPLPGLLSHFSLRIQAHPLRTHWQMQLLIGLSIGLAVMMGWAIWGLSRDNQRRQKIQSELHKAMQAATDANRAKTELLANISHEIRTPLGVIKGFCRLAQRPSTTREEWHMILSRVERNADNLLDLVNDILDISKVEAGLLDVHKTWISMKDLLEDVVESLKPRALEKNLDFNVVWSPDQNLQIYTDPMRLRQILFNVVGNAIKFTENGAVWVNVWLQLDQGRLENIDGRRARLNIEVKDTGIGIDEAGKQRLFQSFSQADSSIGRRYGGSGLGLALSRRLARLLGGDLVLKSSQIGKGSCFELFMTVDSRDRSETNLLASTGNSLKKSLNERPKPMPFPLADTAILIVEDCSDNQLIYQSFLENAGATVKLASNGIEALDRVAQSQPDLIIMDIQMPIMDGYETMKRIRALGIQVPIVVLSAHAMKGERERAFQSGCHDYLVKPVQPDELIATLRNVLEDKSDKRFCDKSTYNYMNQSSTVVRVNESYRTKLVDHSAELLVSVLKDDPRVAPLLKSFLLNCQKKLNRMHECVDQRQFEELARLAHQLKGTSVHYGYPQFLPVAAEIEDACLNSATEPDYIKIHVQTLSSLVDRAWEGYLHFATNDEGV